MPTKFSPVTKIGCNSPWKLRGTTKSTSFDDCPKCPRNCPRTKKKIVCNSPWELERTQSTSFDNYQKCPRNYSRTPKQCAIIHEKCENGPNRRVLMVAVNDHAIVPSPKTAFNSSQTLREQTKSTSFDDCQQCPWNFPGPQNKVLWLTKTTTKDQIDYFWWMP